MIGTLPLALIWRPFFPAAITLTGVVIMLALSVWSFTRSARHRPVLGVSTLLMRCLLLTLIGLLLMGPSAQRPTGTSLTRPVMTILLDTSGSMQTPDMDSLPRYDFATNNWLSPDQLAILNDTYDVRLFTFDETRLRVDPSILSRPASESATGGMSHIARAVRESLDSNTTDGSTVLVLSDGRDTLDAPMLAVAAAARARQTPIYTVPLGGPSMSRDLAVIAIPKQPYLFADEPGSITVRVMQSNAARDSTTLHVTQGARHDTFPIRFDNQNTAAVDIPIEHAEPGTYEYTVRVDPIPGEADEANNSQPVFIEVTAKRLRVLVLEGQPYWDTKFLAHALRKDPRIELTQITQISPDKRETLVSRQGAKATLPTTLEELADFDVIVLGKHIPNVLDARTIELLPRYVSGHGGRLVFARGRAYDQTLYTEKSVRQAFDVIEPVVFGQGRLHNQQIELDPIAMMQPGLAPDTIRNTLETNINQTDTPALLNMPVVEREKAAARVLARVHDAGMGRSANTGQPAIVTMPYGRGMVVAVLGEGLWRWGLRPRKNDTPDNAFDRFWMDTVRWLALGSDYQPGKPISLQLSRLGVQAGDPISIDLLSRTGFGRHNTTVTIQSPDGKQTTAALSPVEGSTTRMRTILNPTAPGVYRVSAHSDQLPDDPIEAKFNCYDIDIERMHNAANRGAMRTLAESSGGRCLDPHDPHALHTILHQQRQAMQTPPRPYYLWDKGWIMTAILTWLGLEWIIRRAGGLL